MNVRPVVAASLLALSLTTCASQEDAAGDDGTWVGTITTEGGVTRVVNESGSVWGGTALLVEELSIGVASGADEYMFGSIDAIYADDERIYVADSQVPMVRVYDHDGAFITNIGRRGEGPGEYSYPGPITAAADGRVFVLDARHARVNVYAPDGEPLDTWPGTVSICCTWPMFLLGGPERLWVPGQERYDPENPIDRTFGFQAIGPEGHGHPGREGDRADGDDRGGAGLPPRSDRRAALRVMDGRQSSRQRRRSPTARPPPASVDT